MKIAPVLLVLVPDADAGSEQINVERWNGLFAYHHDYTMTQTAGLEREYEPVEVKLSIPVGQSSSWRDHIRVVRLTGNHRGVLVPHRVLVEGDAVAEADDNPRVPFPTQKRVLINNQ